MLKLLAGPAQGCGGYLSMPMGMFGSPDPNLDGVYEPQMNCLWTIEMPVNKAVNLTFDSFELETSTNCRYDYVRVSILRADISDSSNINSTIFILKPSLHWHSVLVHLATSGSIDSTCGHIH